jgi:hypothetical protein
MSSTHSVPPRPRIAAIVVALVASAALFVTGVATIVSGVLGGYLYWGEALLVTDQRPFMSGQPNVEYNGISFSSMEPLVGARAASTVADVLHQLVLLALAGNLALVAGSLILRRPFTRALRWGLVVLGGLVLVSSAIAPQLDALASDLAVQELGFPAATLEPSTLGPSTPQIHGTPADAPAPAPDEQDGEHVLLTAGTWPYILMRVDAGLAAIGITLVLLGILIRDGIRLQRDTEGLV